LNSHERLVSHSRHYTEAKKKVKKKIEKIFKKVPAYQKLQFCRRFLFGSKINFNFCRRVRLKMVRKISEFEKTFGLSWQRMAKERRIQLN
jgi:hypothetical protein